MNSITIRRPDDFNVSIGQGAMIKKVAPFIIESFGKAVISGNNHPLITSGRSMVAHKNTILDEANVMNRSSFVPIMSLMLTKDTTDSELVSAYGLGARVLKIMPIGVFAGNYTISLRNLKKYYKLLQTAQDIGMILSIHCEVAEDSFGKLIPEINRETEAIPFLMDLLEKLPNIKVVVENISTAEMVDVIKDAESNVAASVTFHHLALTHADVFYDGIINSINFCRPVPKYISDKLYIFSSIFSSHDRFFFGSGSVPFLTRAKNGNHPRLAPGLFTSPVAIPGLWQLFSENLPLGSNREKDLKLINKTIKIFENFVSVNGSKFYGLPLNNDTITLDKVVHSPYSREYGDMAVFIPFNIKWKIRK